MTAISTTDVVAGTTSDASIVNNNFTAVKNVVNGNLDNSNIAASAGIAISKLQGYPADATQFLRGDGTWSAGAIPAGVILDYGASSAPAGYLLCDGSAVSRATYATLFGVIGTNYGVGDGATTFNVPDFRGRVVAGKGTHADVNAYTDNDGLAESSRTPSHAHNVTITNNVTKTDGGQAVAGAQTVSSSSTAPAYGVATKIIKT